MYTRSKSESCFNTEHGYNSQENKALFSQQRNSAPSSLNENPDLTNFLYGRNVNFKQTKNKYNDRIRTDGGYVATPTGLSGGDNIIYNKDHAKFLESKLFAANAHIQQLENSNESVWNDEKIREVSLAMKEYMNDSQFKEENYKETIKRLEFECVQKDDKMKKNKEQIQSEKSSLLKEQQTNEIELKSKIEDLKTQLLLKNEDIEKLNNQNETTRLRLQNYEKQTVLKISESKSNEVTLLTEMEQIKKRCLEFEQMKDDMNEENLKFQLKVTTFKVIETNLKNDLKFANDEIKKYNEKCINFQNELCSSKSELNELKAQNKQVNEKLEQARNIEIILSDKVETLMRHSQVNARDDSSELQKSNETLKKRIDELNEEILKHKKELLTFESKANNDMKKIQENEERNKKLLTEIEEAQKREETLEQQILNYKKENSNTTNNKLENAINNLKENHLIIENRLKLEKEELTKELNASKELMLKSQVDCELFKSKLHEYELEKQKLVLKLEHENTLSKSQLSQADEELQRSVNEVNSIKDRNQELSNYIVQLKSQIDNRNDRILSNYKLEDEALKEALLLSQNKIEEWKEQNKQLQDAMKNLNENKNKELSDLHNKISLNEREYNKCMHSYIQHCESLEKEKESLLSSIKELKDSIDHLSLNENQYKSKIDTLRNESHQLNATLFEMKDFMKGTREDLEMLRKENQNELEVNQNLTQSYERLQVENEMLKSTSERLTFEKSEISNKLKELDTKKDQHQEYISKIQVNCKETEVKLKQAEKLLIEKETAISKLKSDHEKLFNELKDKHHESEAYRVKCYEFVQNLEDMQKQLLETSKSLEQENKECLKLEQEVDDLKSKKNKLEVQYRFEADEAKENERKILTQLSKLKVEINTLEVQKDARQTEVTKIKNELELKKEKCNQLSKSLNVNEVRLEEVTKHYEKLKEAHSSLLKDLKKNESIIEEKTMEIDMLKKRLFENDFQKKEYDSKLKFNNECLEKFKSKNTQLVNEIQALKDRQNSNVTEHQHSNTSLKDLKKELVECRKENLTKADEISSLKGYIKEQQGVMDGNVHKHDWVLKHEQEQSNEMQYLKQNLCELQMQLLQGKEQYLRLEFECEKFTELSKSKDLEYNKAVSEFQTYKLKSEEKERENEKQVKIYDTDLNTQKVKIQKLCNEIDKCNIFINEIQSVNSTDKIYLVKIEEQNANFVKEIETLKQSEINYKEVQRIIEQKFLKLHRELIKVIFQCKEVKRERDSLRAVLGACEEEKQHYQQFTTQLKSESEKLRRDLNDSNQQKQQIHNENEAIKSRLGILKFSESTRTNERNEILEKLRANELELKALRKIKVEKDITLTPIYKSEPYTNRLKIQTPSRITFNDLQYLSESVNKPLSTEKPIISKMNELNDFLKDLSDKQENVDYKNVYSSTPKSYQTIEKTKTCRNNRYKNEKMREKKEPKVNNVSNLFEQSKVLHSSLLSDMSSLAQEISFEKYLKRL